MDEDSSTTGERLVRIETKLDNFLSRFEDHEARIRTLEKNLPVNADERLTGVERWKYALPASVLGTVIAAAVAIYGALGR